MSSENAPGSLKSKLLFLAVIAVTLAGTAFWVLLTLWGTEPLGPTQAKEFAEAFERECFLELQDETACRKAVGQTHRECLFENIERVEPGTGDNGGDITHDRDGYMRCMRTKTGISH